MGCIFFCFTTRPILIMCVLTSTSTLSFSLTLGMRRLARHQRPCKHFNERSLFFPFLFFGFHSPCAEAQGRLRPCAEACQACRMPPSWAAWVTIAAPTGPSLPTLGAKPGALCLVPVSWAVNWRVSDHSGLGPVGRGPQGGKVAATHGAGPAAVYESGRCSQKSG
jgi:hypothetical protein